MARGERSVRRSRASNAATDKKAMASFGASVMMRGPPFVSDRTPPIAQCGRGPCGLGSKPIRRREEAMTNRRQFLNLTLGLPFSSGGVWLGSDRLRAQEPWPTRTITLVVPFPPGGVADFAARPPPYRFSEKFRQNFRPENGSRPGGG